MKLSDMKRARELLRANCAKVDVQAVEYLDWDAFEGVLEAVMAAEPTQDMIMRVFQTTIQKAQVQRVLHRPIGPTN